MSRPPHPEPHTRKSISLPDRLWAEIADVRRAFDQIPPETEVIRMLLREALDARRERKDEG